MTDLEPAPMKAVIALPVIVAEADPDRFALPNGEPSAKKIEPVKGTVGAQHKVPPMPR
jgi:hypothetical protein